MTDKELIHIEKYLAGELSESETNQFSRKMETDIELSNSVKKQKILLEGITTYGNKELKARLGELSATYSKDIVVELPRQAKQFNWKKILAAAAVILAISTFVTVQYFMNSDNPSIESNHSQFAHYFNPIELSNTRATSESIDISTFNNGDYKSAISVLQDVLTTRPDRTDITIALANSYYATKAPKKSLELLTVIIESNDPVFSDQAKWYSALCYLKLGENDQAVIYLNELVSNSNADFHKEANQLLNELK